MLLHLTNILQDEYCHECCNSYNESEGYLFIHAK